MKMISYSPFSTFPFALRPIDDPIVRSIAAVKIMDGSLDASSPLEEASGQIILRWIVQQGLIFPIPFSFSSLYFFCRILKVIFDIYLFLFTIYLCSSVVPTPCTIINRHGSDSSLIESHSPRKELSCSCSW